MSLILPDEKCLQCKSLERTNLFDLCTREESQYLSNEGRQEFHTIGHMRRHACGEEARLCRKK